MQSLGLLVEVEGEGFVSRLPTFLPLLHHCLSTQTGAQTGTQTETQTGGESTSVAQQCSHGEGTVTEEDPEISVPGGTAMVTDNLPTQSGLEEEEEEEEEAEEEEAAMDGLLVSTLMTLEKIASSCSVLRGPQHAAEMGKIWGGLGSRLRVSR